jgi:hypothetical protein
MLAESLQRVDIRPQSNFLNVDDASTSVTKGLNQFHGAQSFLRANSCLATQNIVRILWNLRVLYHDHEPTTGLSPVPDELLHILVFYDPIYHHPSTYAQVFQLISSLMFSD